MTLPSDSPFPANTPAAAIDGAAEGLADLPRHPQGRFGKRLNWLLFVYAFSIFSLMLITLTPSIFSLAYKVQILDAASKEASLGLVVSVGALINIIAAPIFGRWSDNVHVSWGRRRPFLVAGIIMAVVGFIVIASASSIAAVVVGWSIASIANAAISTAFQVILVDFVPEEKRGRFAALNGVSIQIAGVAATLLGAALTFNIYALFLVPVIFVVIAAVLYWVTVPDTPATRKPDAERAGNVFSSFLFNPRKHKDFSLVWLGKFVIQVGLAFFSTYQLYFLLDRLGMTPQDAGVRLALVGGLGLIVTSVGAVVAGALSDRLRRRKPFIYGSAVLFAVGMLTVAFAHDFVLYAIGALLILAAAGVFGATDVALASDVIPKDDAAKFMNIYGTSPGLANAAAPALAPAILAIGAGSNYTALYIAAAALALFGGLVVVGIRAVR